MAFDCWNSPGYGRARDLRLAAASADVIVIEGYDGAQPVPPDDLQGQA
jgi:hypothetical protein